MTRLILLGLVTIAIVIIAPLIGASRSVSVDPDRPASWLLGRPIIPELPEESGGDQVEPSDRRDNDEEWRDRRNRDEEWHDRQRDREEWWDDEDRQRDREEARDFFEEIFN